VKVANIYYQFAKYIEGKAKQKQKIKYLLTVFRTPGNHKKNVNLNILQKMSPNPIDKKSQELSKSFVAALTSRLHRIDASAVWQM
jgi:hypothetical protein